MGTSTLKAGEDVLVCIRPEDIMISREIGKSSVRNVLKVKISKIVPLGPLARVKMENSLVALITKQAAEDLQLNVGDEVYATFKATSVHLACG
jgi:molybdopterin-binding protein